MKRIDLVRRVRDRDRSLGADRLRRAAAAVQIDPRLVDDSARRALFAV